MRGLVVVSLVGLLAGTGTTAAAAESAPSYVSSEPEDGEELHKAPGRVTITFSEPLDTSSTMTVEDHCGRAVDDGNVDVDINEMSVGIAKKPSGHYEVTYAAVGFGGVTGTENGRFHFMVHAGPSCGDAQDDHHDGHNGHDRHDGQHDGHKTHEGRPDGDAHEGEHGAGGAGHDSEDHGGHAAAGAGGHAEHGEHPRAQAAQQLEKQRDAQRTQALRTGETPFPGGVPDSEAVLVALFLCALLGVVGGWILRVSPLS